MGLTYAQSFLRSHITSKEDMMILEKSPEKAAILSQKDIGTVYGSPEGCFTIADLIIFAVKPQDANVLFETLKPLADNQQVFMSIMAGVKIETICEALGVKKVIRAMPNLPAQIGMGMTAFTSSNEVTRIELVMVQNLLNTTGKTIYVENEKLYLAIHIADPTEYIDIKSDLWKNIMDRVVTRYPSNRKPVHMMPEKIMAKASLMDNEYGNIKMAITVLTEIDRFSFEPIGNVKLLFSKVKVKKEN